MQATVLTPRRTPPTRLIHRVIFFSPRDTRGSIGELEEHPALGGGWRRGALCAFGWFAVGLHQWGGFVRACAERHWFGRGLQRVGWWI